MEHDSPYQVMYKLGKGDNPPYPEDIEEEAEDFLKSCFVFNPTERATASALLDHPFVKVVPSAPQTKWMLAFPFLQVLDDDEGT